MGRIKLAEYPRYPFAAELHVRVGDLNYGAHLGYDRLLGLAHDARLALFDRLGVTELDLGDGATGLVAADVAVVYQGEAFRGDRLVFEILAAEVGAGSFRLAHRVRGPNGRGVALIEIGFAAYDYRARRAARLPDGFRERLLAAAGDRQEGDR